jgi:Fur family transcriptional regulator, ferric uptake regulator
MKQLNALLHHNGLRFTPQRKAILELLASCQGQHLDVQTIHSLLEETFGRDGGSGLATVYRTVDLFVRLGLVNRLEMENAPARYELAQEGNACHHHLVCTACGQMTEVGGDTLQAFISHVLEETGFAVSDGPICFHGLCEACRKQKKQACPNEQAC